MDLRQSVLDRIAEDEDVYRRVLADDPGPTGERSDLADPTVDPREGLDECERRRRAVETADEATLRLLAAHYQGQPR